MKKSQSRIFSTRRKKYHLVNAKLARKKKRKKSADSQRVLRMVVLSILIVSIGLSGYMLWRFISASPTFLILIENIKVAGAETFSETDIVAMSGLKEKSNYFNLSVRAVEKRIERQPNIGDATVIKDWNSVLITIRERRPITMIKYKGKDYLFDESGVAFPHREGLDISDLPKIHGLKDEEPVPGRKCKNNMFGKVLKMLVLYNYNKLYESAPIDIVDISHQDDIILWTRSGRKVKRGVKIELGNKDFEQTLAMMGSILAKRKTPFVEYLDMTGSEPVGR